MMKSSKNILITLILTCSAYMASASTIIGTGVLADLNDNTNVYIQMGMAKNVALNIDIASGGANSTALGLAGKIYLGSTGLFVKAGAAFGSGKDGVSQILLVGIENSNQNIVYGVEGGQGAVAGEDAVSLYVGIRF